MITPPTTPPITPPSRPFNSWGSDRYTKKL
jgi:hypothetical protein